ncbi:hypothetical protein [Curtobacterium sp. 9128]|uniref:hypothetical protein n=1 Tax=Curtobacterium sp. 9128 TaxID=1793722 RepID=UPI0021B2E5F5|nr:hypothetical protein [Curtobacterium sp. 9128]
MISTTPDPGNPWPHDMRIVVENDAQTLLELLWVREAWALEPIGDDLPPLLVDTPSLEAGRNDVDRSAWTAAWPRMWHASLTTVGSRPGPEVFERLGDPTIPQAEREELLEQVSGPWWSEEFGDEAFTERHQTWTSARFDDRTSSRVLRSNPEWERLEQLVPAWRAGLTTIIEIPCRGSFTRRVGAHALLVTEATRADADAYAGALRSFG